MAHLRIFISFEFDKDNNLMDSFFRQAREQSQHRVRHCVKGGGV